MTASLPGSVRRKAPLSSEKTSSPRAHAATTYGPAVAAFARHFPHVRLLSYADAPKLDGTLRHRISVRAGPPPPPPPSTNGTPKHASATRGGASAMSSAPHHAYGA